MKKIFLLIVLFLIPSFVFSAENTSSSQNLNEGFSFSQDSKSIYLLYKGKKIYSEKYLPEIGIACADWEYPKDISTNKQKKFYCWNNHFTTQYIGNSWYIFTPPGYEGLVHGLYNIKTNKILLPPVIDSLIQSVQVGKNGVYILTDDFSRNGQSLYLLLNTGDLIKQWEGYEYKGDAYISSFELLSNKRIKLNLLKKPIYNNKINKYEGEKDVKIISIKLK